MKSTIMPDKPQKLSDEFLVAKLKQYDLNFSN